MAEHCGQLAIGPGCTEGNALQGGPDGLLERGPARRQIEIEVSATTSKIIGNLRGNGGDSGLVPVDRLRWYAPTAGFDLSGKGQPGQLAFLVEQSNQSSQGRFNVAAKGRVGL